MTLYQILGVAPDASGTVIKSAYKKLCMKHHPDRDGDLEVFKQIQKAYDILSDPKRRATYDDTGTVEEPPDVDAQALQYLSSLLSQILQKVDTDHINIVDVMWKEIARMKGEHEVEIYKADQAISLCEKVKNKTHAKKSHVIYQLQDGLIQQHTLVKTANTEKIRILDRMRELIDDVTYDVTPFFNHGFVTFTA